MRSREIIRDRQKSANTDSVNIETIEQYLRACQCPYCRDGRTYKMVALHIYQIHDISAYDFRERFGMDRGHQLCSSDTSELMALRHAKPNKAFMEYDRHKSALHRYEDGGQREETVKRKQNMAKRPEVKLIFQKAMSAVDRKAVAASISPELRKARAHHAHKIWSEKVPRKRQKEILGMKLARAARTPESEKIRVQHAQVTMREYWNNPEWRSKWRKRITEVRQASARIPRSDYANIVRLYEDGISQSKIASQYGVSHGLIHLIIKCHKLGLPTLQG